MIERQIRYHWIGIKIDYESELQEHNIFCLFFSYIKNS